MRKYTRRRKLTKVKPRIGTQYGGAVHSLPDVQSGMKYKEFISKYDVFYIVAHGMYVDTSYKVPSNTFLLNMAPSGYICMHNEKVEQIFYEETSGEGNNAGLYATSFWDFIQNPVGTKHDPYLPVYDPKQAPTNMNIKTAIYEPDDNVPDQELIFQNHGFFGGIGVFKVPIPEHILKLKLKNSDTIMKLKRKEIELLQKENTTVSVNMIMPIVDTIIKSELTKMDSHFLNLKQNLFGPILNRRERSGVDEPHKIHLSELLMQPELNSNPGKKRLFIIQSCRNIPYNATISATEMATKLRDIRRRSITLRKYAIPSGASGGL